VLVIAFCDHELSNRICNRLRNRMGSPSPQNAATNTLQACAPQNKWICRRRRSSALAGV